MLKRPLVLVLSLIALCILIRPTYPVKAQEQALSMSVTCPTKAYIGESFFCQVTIYNNDTATHEYALLWTVDSIGNVTPTFKTSGIIEPNETIDTGSSFTFSNARDKVLSFLGYNAHIITITLVGDGYLLASEDRYVNVISADASVVALALTPSPTYTNSTFSLNLAVTNEGQEDINATVYAYEPLGMQSKIQLQSGATAPLGSIIPSSLKNATFNFAVAYNTPPGVYAIKVKLDFYDTRGKSYSKVYYILITISPTDRLDIVEAVTTQEINKLKSDLDVANRNTTIIVTVVLIVSVGLALANYWYAHRLGQTRRKITAEKTR